MAATEDRLDIGHLGPAPFPPSLWELPAVVGQTYYRGVMLVQDATGRLAKYSPGAGLPVVGLYDGLEYTAKATDRIQAKPGAWKMKISVGDPVTIADSWKIVYGEDDETIARTDAGGTLDPVGTLFFVNGSAYVWLGQPVGAIGALATQAASIAAIQGHLTAQSIIPLVPTDFALLTGAPLALFADGASAVPGLALADSKAQVVRWNNNATLDPILTSFAIPPDMDVTQNAIVVVYASKTGATPGDAPTFSIGAFNQIDGQLYDADVDFGGLTGAMNDAAPAKTIQTVTRVLTAANLAAHPAQVTLSVKPTDGTLTTDDLVLHRVVVLYTKKLTA